MNRDFLRSVSWFGVIQIGNFVLPLAAVPYLARALLPHAYGVTALALAIATFLSTICEYGFNWSAMRLVSAHRNDLAYLRRLFVNVMCAKFGITLLVALIYCFVLIGVPWMRQNITIYSIAFLATLGGTCFPAWFLQGIERMATLAGISFVARLACILLLFIVVHRPEDAPLATFLMSAPALLSGLGGIWIVYRFLGEAEWPDFYGVVAQWRDGWSTFLGTLTIGAYTSGQGVLVGALGGPVIAGYFVAADKCLSVGKALLSIVTQSALPRVAYLAEHAPDDGIMFIRRLLWLIPMAAIASLGMALVPAPIIRILFGEPFVPPVVPLLQILSPVPILVSLTSCCASLYMFNFGLRKLWSSTLIAASVVSLMTTVLANLFVPAHIAAALGATMAEAFVAVLSGTMFYRATQRSKARRSDAILGE